MLDLKFNKSASIFLKKCDNILYKRFIKKIKELSKNPFPQDTKRVVGKKEKTFRIRVGGYRITYTVFMSKKTIVITDIDERGRVYKR